MLKLTKDGKELYEATSGYAIVNIQPIVQTIRAIQSEWFKSDQYNSEIISYLKEKGLIEGE
jgi:hypothetical protein